MLFIATAFLIYTLVLLAERALVEANPHDIELLQSDSTPAARRALSAIGQIRPALAALLLSRILIKVLVSVLLIGLTLRYKPLHLFFYKLAQEAVVVHSFLWIAFTLLAAAFVALLFHGLKVRTNVKVNAVVTLKRLGGFILFWKGIFAPLIKSERKDQGENQEPIETAQADKEEADEEDKQEIQLLKSIVRFADVTVKQVMQPRSNIVAVAWESDFHEVLNTVKESEFSRLPVYSEALDNIKGILYVKDLLPYMEYRAGFHWQKLVRQQVPMIPESKHGIELLEDFKRKKVHMAMVVDEFGGVEGIVTLEDILEEVTGDIQDEFDEEQEPNHHQLDQNNWLFDGKTLLNDACSILGFSNDHFDTIRGNADTLAGIAISISGGLPEQGDEMTWNDMKFTVTEADQRRIRQLKITLLR